MESTFCKQLEIEFPGPKQGELDFSGNSLTQNTSTNEEENKTSSVSEITQGQRPTR